MLRVEQMAPMLREDRPFIKVGTQDRRCVKPFIKVSVEDHRRAVY